MTVRKGCSRLVFLIGKYAIKVPNFTYGWESFLHGLLDNMREQQVWRVVNSDAFEEKIDVDKFCPVLFAGLGGLLLIQPRCSEFRGDLPVIDWVRDIKDENCGILNGKVVVFDYAN